MRKIVSTIVAIGFLSSMQINPAFAGDRHGGGINPLWVPVAILSTLAAVTISQPPPVVYERRVYYDQRPTVIYEPPPMVVYDQPRQYRHGHHYDRRSTYYNHDERVRAYETPQPRYYR